LYDQHGDAAQAAAVLEKVLADAPNPAVLEFAEDFYRKQGETDKANEVLSRLSELDLEPGQAELIRGRTLARGGDTAGALEAYREATRIAPDRGATWVALVIQRVIQGQGAKAQDALREA